MASEMEQVMKEAKAIFEKDFVVLDTETTGLDENAEIVEIAILDKDGKALLDTLVKPKNRIPTQASNIHGITNRDVKNAPSWDDIYSVFREVIKNKTVVIYNSKYDNRIIKQTCSLYGLPNPRRKTECAMLLYANYRNITNKSTGNAKWHKLTEALDQCGIPQSTAHRARGDCEMTLNLLRFMAGEYEGPFVEVLSNSCQIKRNKSNDNRVNNHKVKPISHLLVAIVVDILGIALKAVFSIIKGISKK
ncbi:TPA: exonuclease domain-containing protein [Salmonella enterica subsp. enterica serovar Mbandaka]